MNPALPRDPVLPHLGVALEPEAMRAVFESVLGTANRAARFRLESCSIERVKYKPGKNCLVCYRLAFHSETNDKSQLLCARLYPKGTSYSRYRRAKKDATKTPNFGESVMHLPGLDMVVWAFPNDRKLQALPQLMDVVWVRENVVPLLVGADWKGSEMCHDLIHYVPEHTCTVRITLEGGQPLSFYGKTYYDDEGAETYRLMRHLEEKKVDSLRTARALHYDADNRMLWQEGLAGSPLIGLELEHPDFHTSLQQAACAVASLHQTNLECERAVSLQDWLDKLNDMRTFLPQVRPTCRARLESLISSLLEQAACLKTQPLATLHGDLHLQNFLVAGGEVALIDLDNLCTGSPWQDVGSFIAGLYYRGLLETLPLATIERLAITFCRSYLQACPYPNDEPALRWYTAAALINERAFRSVTRLKSGRLELLDDLITLAERFVMDPVALEVNL